MINLIPTGAKKNIVLEYWMRVVSVWAYLWAATIIAAICITIPTYVLITIQVGNYEASAASARESVLDHKSTTKSLADASRQAAVIMAASERQPLHAYIQLLERTQGESITINQISAERTAEGIGPVVIAGNATDRNALAAFRDRLLAEPAITAVDLPISNLAKDKDIQFSLTVTIDHDVHI